MGYLVYGVWPRGTGGRRGRRGGHHDLFLFKHAKRPCKLAPGHVMVATHLPLLRDGRRADQVLQWPGATLELLPSTIWVRLRFKPFKLDLGGVFFLLFATPPRFGNFFSLEALTDFFEIVIRLMSGSDFVKLHFKQRYKGSLLRRKAEILLSIWNLIFVRRSILKSTK